MTILLAAARPGTHRHPSLADFLAAAEQWVADRWPVFVRPMYLDEGKVVKGGFRNCPACPRESQHPQYHRPEQCACGQVLCHGSHAATLDLTRAARMLAQAQRRGAARGSLLALSVRVPADGLVLDPDRHPGGADGVAALAALDALGADGKGETVRTNPETRMVVTGGGGYHFYYSGWDAGKAPAVLLPGLEVKTAGQNLVVPPSTTPLGARYWEHDSDAGRPLAAIQPIPPRLRDLLLGKRDAARPPVPVFSSARPPAFRHSGDPLAAVMDALADLGKAVKPSGYPQEWLAQCPAHPDRNPSLVVMDKGKQVTLHCRSGCDHSAVLAALNLRNSALKRGNAA